MIKVVRFLFVGFISFGLATEVILSQDTLKQGYDHPHYAGIWPFDLEFEKDFSTPDSIISSDSGEISIGYEFDTSGNIYNIFIYSITLRGDDGSIVYKYSVTRDSYEFVTPNEKDRMYYNISCFVYDYIYNDMKLIRNEKPFFRERYRANYTIRF